MISIILVTLKLIILLYYVGYGFTSILLPKQFRKDFIWFVPWVATASIAILGVIFSLGKFSMNQSAHAIVVISTAVLIYAYFNKKLVSIDFKNNLFYLGATIVIFILNIAPLIIRVGFATVISLGNLDPISYGSVGDFLRDHTVWDGATYQPYSPFMWSVGDLLHYSYRWGSPMVLSFFSSILQVRSYEIYSILINLYFALSLPLVGILTQKLLKRDIPLISLFLVLTYALNATLSYMLYNVFFAQFLFSGLYLCFIILLISYQPTKEKSLFNLIDIFAAIFISSITTIYPEGLLFVFLPLIFIIILKYLFNNRDTTHLQFIVKILLLAFIISPTTFQSGIKQNLAVIFANTKPGFIGWENIPYASPAEMMGFYNLYYSRRLPFIVFSILSLPIIFLWVVGYVQTQKKIVISSFLITFLLLLFNFKFLNHNFFLYHRSLTYGLFLFSILFSIGAAYILSLVKKRLFKYVILLVFIVVTARSFHRTWYQLYWHMSVVDKALVSLREINENPEFQYIIYTGDVILGEYDLWKRLWREQILMDKKIITSQNYRYDIEVLPEQTYVLAEKGMLSYDRKKIKFKRIMWENEYYILGETEKISKDL